jgi:HPt (histidine-containing phosphotransfer) domain-containing protein
VGQAEPHLSRLATAVAAGDAAEVRFVAHALTGSGRSLGAVAFGEACARLERVGKGGELAEAPHALALVLDEWKRLRERLDAHRDRSAA